MAPASQTKGEGDMDNAPEGCKRDARANGTAYPRYAYLREYTTGIVVQKTTGNKGIDEEEAEGDKCGPKSWMLDEGEEPIGDRKHHV